jgi:hypothetical protein
VTEVLTEMVVGCEKRGTYNASIFDYTYNASIAL